MHRVKHVRQGREGARSTRGQTRVVGYVPTAYGSCLSMMMMPIPPSIPRITALGK